MNPCKYSCATRCPQVLTSLEVAFISTIIQHQRIIYLDELQNELWTKHHKYAMFSTLLQTLEQLSITHKIVSSPAC